CLPLAVLVTALLHCERSCSGGGISGLPPPYEIRRVISPLHRSIPSQEPPTGSFARVRETGSHVLSIWRQTAGVLPKTSPHPVSAISTGSCSGEHPSSRPFPQAKPPPSRAVKARG